MNKKEIISSVTSNEQFMRRYKKFVDDGDMDLALALADCMRGRFAKSHEPSEHPHIQSENNGGVLAWDKLCYLLVKHGGDPPRDNRQDKEEYVGYTRDHRNR